jgi:hypothetical protein
MSISIHPFQMSGSSENDSSHQSGGESDCEGSAASSHESELPDTVKPRRNEQIQGRVWILRGEITTTLLHNDSASMEDCDNDEEAKVQRSGAAEWGAESLRTTADADEDANYRHCASSW